jgi:hypothetical protein
VGRSIPLPGGSGHVQINLNRPVAIVNGENVRAQCRKPKYPRYFHAIVAAKISQIQGDDVVGNQVLSCNREMYSG